jgi:hypothetical protein
MSIVYNVYANDGRGGLVNYAAPIGTTASLTFNPPALAAPSDTTFVVRAFDTSVGIEEANTQARVRIVIDANGQDVTAIPNAPGALFVRATQGGGCLATWAYNPAGQAGPPAGFSVFLTPGTAAAYTTPTATVPFVPGQVGYSCELAGLADGSTYTVAVRAYNAVATEANTTVVARVVGDSTPPEGVDALRSSTSFEMS